MRVPGTCSFKVDGYRLGQTSITNIIVTTGIAWRRLARASHGLGAK